jgi:hypothetical protein
MYSFWHKTDWAKFWAIFSQSHLVTLVETTLNHLTATGYGLSPLKSQSTQTRNSLPLSGRPDEFVKKSIQI